MYKSHCVLALVALFVGLARSWDFAMCYGDQLTFYTDGMKPETILFKSQNLSALAYDELHNRMFYVDKQSNNDAIYEGDLSNMTYKYIIERNGRNIHGLAFDPATELLFFSDTNEKSIYSFSLKPEAKNNINGNLLIKMDDGIPTDIAVDSCGGYIYWINTHLTQPAIERARFNGSEREVITFLSSVLISKHYFTPLEPKIHNFAIDPRTQKMYWIAPDLFKELSMFSMGMNGETHIMEFEPSFDDFVFANKSNQLTVSKNGIVLCAWSKNGTVVEQAKNGTKHLFDFYTEKPAGIIANYKIIDQVQGLTDCDALTSLVRYNSEKNNSLKIDREYEGPFCVMGVNVSEQSDCKCPPGYSGERCDVSMCVNYCLHGTCNIDKGFPSCSCFAGFFGSRCEIHVCQDYCLNYGTCDLYKSRAVCQCESTFVGDRCEVSICQNYCYRGNCSIDEDRRPTCSCDAGFSGERCQVYACDSYCLNDSECYLNEEAKPICKCDGNHEGSRCEDTKAVSVTTPNTTQFSNTTTYYSVTKYLTIADFLTIWYKPMVKVEVAVEV